MADDELFLRECLAYLEAPSPPLPLEPALLARADGGGSSDAQRLLDALYEPLVHHQYATPPPPPPSSSSSSSQSSSPSSSVTSLSHRATAAKNKPKVPSRNSTRERMQSELRELRTQRAALEHTLTAMKSQNNQLQLQQQYQRNPPSQSHMLLLATWKRIAERQLEQRQRAEAENAQLKLKVENNLAITRAFQQSIEDWMAQANGTPSSSVSSLHRMPSPHQIALKSTAFADPRDVKIYELLVSQLDDAAGQMDAVFQENGLSQWQLGSPPSKVQMKSRQSSGGDHNNAMYIEFLDVDVLPFPKRVVFNASWQRWEQRSLAKSSVVYENLPQTKDIFASKSCCEIFLSEDSAASISMEFLSVTKAYRYEDRVVYVWRGITKSDSQFPGAYVDETGWQVVRAITESDGDGAFENGSVLFTCTQLEPRYDQAVDELQARSVVPLANLVLSAYKVDMQEVSDLMMNLLLQDATSCFFKL